MCKTLNPMVMLTSDVWRSAPSPLVPKNVTFTTSHFELEYPDLSIHTNHFHPSKGQMMNMCWRQLGDSFYSAQQQIENVTKCKLVVKNICYDKASCKIYSYGNIKGSFMVSLFNFILTVTRGKQFLHVYKSCFDHQALACQNIRLQQSTMNYRTLEQTIGVCLDYIC